VFAAKSCSIPVESLQASPYSLPWGTSVFAKVTATNEKEFRFILILEMEQ